MKELDLKKIKGKTFHFIGIGGISMSGLAEMLLKNGAIIQGSDLSKNIEIERLEKKGAKIFNKHLAENVVGADYVVYTSAIHEDNPEIVYANKHSIPLIKRAELLGLIASGYKTVIAVSGSHGKTTTTAMLSEIFLQAGLKPTLHVGGPLKKIDSNYLIGNKKFFITEACEYKDNFLYIKPDIAVVLNIDADHLDYFGTTDGVKKSFKKFACGVRDGGIIVVSGEDKNSKEISRMENASTFGETKKSDIYAKNVKEYKTGYFSFDTYICGYKLGRIELNLMGRHNIGLALAAILVSVLCGVDFCDIKFALENFTGTERRCEEVGSINGARVFHDYAHHPAQVSKMIEMARLLSVKSGGRVITVFEPHTYSRTKFLLEDFAKAFSGADHAIFVPVYSARENPEDGVDSEVLTNETKKHLESAEYIKTFDETISRLKKITKEEDIVLILGAGTIEKLAHMIK